MSIGKTYASYRKPVLYLYEGRALGLPRPLSRRGRALHPRPTARRRMAAPVAPAPTPQIKPGPRPAISARTLRTDRWWLSPAISFGVLSAFVIYATWAAFIGKDYYSKPYI